MVPTTPPDDDEEPPFERSADQRRGMLCCASGRARSLFCGRGDDDLAGRPPTQRLSGMNPFASEASPRPLPPPHARIFAISASEYSPLPLGHLLKLFCRTAGPRRCAAPSPIKIPPLDTHSHICLDSRYFFSRAQPPELSATMAMKGIRVLTFSPFEMKAFGGFYYEAKKKLLWHYTNISSTWNSMLPIMASLYMLIKWAEGRMEQEHLSHRD